jgi:intracellular sulfur oxidation DsrE/DsrF family protein
MAKKKILQVVESAYRATIEEQDDTVIWFTGAVRAGGADVSVLLRGSAVNYAVRGQDASGLSFGEWKQTRPPDIAEDVQKLVAAGVGVSVVEEDLAARGLQGGDLLGGVTLVRQADIAALVARHDAIWHW